MTEAHPLVAGEVIGSNLGRSLRHKTLLLLCQMDIKIEIVGEYLGQKTDSTDVVQLGRHF